MKPIVFALSYLLLLSSGTVAQKKTDPSPDDIAKAEQLGTQFEGDDIAIVSQIEYITFGFNKKKKKVTVNHNSKEALMNITSRADIQKYIFYDGESEISKFDIHYRNKKEAPFNVKDQSFNSDNMFHNDARVKFTNIDFPVKGYTYLFEIEKKYKDIKYFTKLYFTDDYPIVKKEIKVVVPDWLDVELKELNFEGFEINKQIEYDGKLKANVHTYNAKNMGAIISDRKSPGPSYIQPHLLILPKHYQANGKKEVIFNSTQDLYNWYRSLINQLKDDPTALKDKVTELIKDATTDEEKIKAIYYWVQDNIRYIAFEDGIAGFKPDECQNVFKKRYGDCKGMANLTKQMLKEAGFDARLTWIGTKRIAYDYSTPNLSVDNHMICTVIRDGYKIFLDGTEKFNSLGEYAERIQGKQVLIEDGDTFLIEIVPVQEAALNKELVNYDIRIEGEKLVGAASKSFNGESRTDFLFRYNALKNDKKEVALQWYLNMGDKNYIVNNISTSDLNNRDDLLTMEYEFIRNNAVSSFDNELYIDLDYDKELSKFDLEDRKTDYQFSYKMDLESNTTLTIPENYIVSELPTNLELEHNNYNISISFEHQDQKVIYKKHFVFKNAVISSEDIPTWNTFIKKLKDVYNQQVILVKKS